MEAFFGFFDRHPANNPDIKILLFDMRRAKQPNLFDGLNRGFLQLLTLSLLGNPSNRWNISLLTEVRDLYIDWFEQHQILLGELLTKDCDSLDNQMDSLLTGVGDR